MLLLRTARPRRGAMSASQAQISTPDYVYHNDQENNDGQDCESAAFAVQLGFYGSWVAQGCGYRVVASIVGIDTGQTIVQSAQIDNH